jgi:HK97 family phage portal protein
MSIFDREPLISLGIADFKMQTASTSTLANPSADLMQALLGWPTSSGKPVTRQTAIRVTSFLSCIKMLAGDIAKYPLVLHSQTNKGGRIRTIPATTEPLYPLLRYCPNIWQTSFQMRFFLASQLLMRGNCFAQVIRDGKGDVLSLNPLDAWRMEAYWDLDGTQPKLLFRYRDGHGNLRIFYPSGTNHGVDEVWHCTNMNIEGNGVEGVAIITLAKEALSVLMAAEELAGRQFANGLSMGGFITTPPDTGMTEPEAQNIVDRLKKDFAGSQNAGKFTLLPGNCTWQKMTFNAQESQLLESRQWNSEEIARLLGGAPLIVKLGLGKEIATYAASSAFLEDYHNTSLLPHITAIEQSIARDLIDPADRTRLFAKHNADVVLGGSLRERAETYQIQVNSGQLTPNEARTKEHMDTVDGLDFSVLPANSCIFDPETKEIYIPGQDLPGHEPPQDAPAPNAAPAPPQPVSPPIPPKKKKSKASARLETIAVSLADRIRRKEEKSGHVDPKFVVEVIGCTMQQAQEYANKALTGAEATDALINLVVGAEDDDQ